MVQVRKKVAIVGRDRTLAEDGITRAWVEWHTRLGYEVMIASEWPEPEIPDKYRAFEDGGTQVYSVDGLMPHDPLQGHAYRQQQRCRLMNRLSAAAVAFALDDVDVVVLADTDMLLLSEPQNLLNNTIKGQDAFGLTLPFKRRLEAPKGWLCDMGLILSRKGFEKLQARLPEKMAQVLAECGERASAQGLLQHALRLCGLQVKTTILRGFYLHPDGRRKALFAAKMPEGAWLNSGHAVWVEHGQPFFAYLGIETRLDNGMPLAESFPAMVNSMARRFELPAVATPGRRVNAMWLLHWRTHAKQVRASLRAAKVKTPEKVFWQNWGAMQAAARHYEAHGTLPEAAALPVMGTVAPLDAARVKELLQPEIVSSEDVADE